MSCVVQPSADGAALTGGLMEDTTARWRSVMVVLGQSVVYEHRSRLEKSLQKERLEHKKTKEVLHQWAQDAAHRTLPTGRCPTGRCPTGRCPTGRCPQDAAPQDAAPQDAAPQDAAPQDAAPQDAADYLVYKLEAQQSLNKEKQDAGSRLNSLHGQHQMLKVSVARLLLLPSALSNEHGRESSGACAQNTRRSTVLVQFSS
ncbi:hypothetical protein NFI96_003515 [Prochilodus magdalenae]|nr:hypothetical protein NFI96_003515 [Prochilodus magdalenae]